MSPAERDRALQARGVMLAASAVLRTLVDGAPDDRAARRARHLAELAESTADGIGRALDQVDRERAAAEASNERGAGA